MPELKEKGYIIERALVAGIAPSEIVVSVSGTFAHGVARIANRGKLLKPPTDDSCTKQSRL